jgi:hypothetical protein
LTTVGDVDVDVDGDEGGDVDGLTRDSAESLVMEARLSGLVSTAVALVD